MRISDWSSDVCSSDLRGIPLRTEQHAQDRMGEQREDDREGPADRREIGDAAQVAVLQRMALAQLGGKGRQQDRHESLEDALAVDLEDRKSTRLNSSH